METVESAYDEKIKDAISKYFPELISDINSDAWLWIKAQIWQESRFDPLAKSPVGAQGLMQIMPSTAEYMGYTDPFDPTHNINGGVSYLAKQYQHLREIPDHTERLRFALASYNGGRGYINRALELARAALGFPASYTAWKDSGSPGGDWQHWHYTKIDLRRPECIVHNHHPDYHQIDGYVTKIEARYFFYLSQQIEREALS